MCQVQTVLRCVVLFLLVSLLAGTMAGCALVGQEVAVATPEIPATPELKAPQDVLDARRTVLDFLREGANECVPPRGVTWETKQGAAAQGFEVYRFDSEGCLMTVSYPLPQTAETMYHVTLHNRLTGFCWQANVGADKQVVSTGTAAEMWPELSAAAKTYCLDQGYAYEVQEQPDGRRCGVCIFEGGSSCNAWAFFQGMCTEEGF
jgi:putative hemolysin